MHFARLKDTNQQVKFEFNRGANKSLEELNIKFASVPKDKMDISGKLVW